MSHTDKCKHRDSLNASYKETSGCSRRWGPSLGLSSCLSPWRCSPDAQVQHKSAGSALNRRLLRRCSCMAEYQGLKLDCETILHSDRNEPSSLLHLPNFNYFQGSWSGTCHLSLPLPHSPPCPEAGGQNNKDAFKWKYAHVWEKRGRAGNTSWVDSCHPFPGDCWQAFLLINHSLNFLKKKKKKKGTWLMPFFGALWIWDPFISLDELWQNCVRPTTFADVHRNRTQNRAVLGSGDFPCLSSLLIVFVVGFFLLLPHRSPMTVLLSVNASTIVIMDLYILPRSSWVLVPHLDVLLALDFLSAVLGLA